MKFDKVFVFDSDQYPLSKHLNVNETKNCYIIAASNNKENLLFNGKYYGEVSKLLPESSDAHIVGMLYYFLQLHTTDEIIIATKDKKLLQMLLCLSIKNAKAYLHDCCRYHISFNLSEFNGVAFYSDPRSCHLSSRDINIINHISQYPNGLKLKTLSIHYGICKEKMSNIIAKLEKSQFIEKYFNVYRCGKRYVR